MPNPGGALRGGTFATGRVVSRTLDNVARRAHAPRCARRRTTASRSSTASTARRSNVAPVQLGVVDERQGVAQVTEGLQAGDRVIVGNVGTLGRGMQVTIAGTRAAAGPHGP